MAPQSKLQLSLHGDRAIVITRDFAAPRALVFDALTKPELLLRWFSGPPGWVLETCEVDLRVGGRYRYVWVKPAAGQALGMGGEYLAISRPDRIVQTYFFLPRNL